MLWLHATNQGEYVWIDQFCVPQDADIEVKMACIRASPEIYRLGKVFVVLAPVTDASGTIVCRKRAAEIVKKYQNEFHHRRDLGAVAEKALMVNSSYMRRVWTIQEAVAATDLSIWPMQGSGELNSYQSIYVIDWPQFNAWNGWPGLGPLRENQAKNTAVQSYLDGDFRGIIDLLESKPDGVDCIAHLALISKEIMWITMDRNGLVNDLKRGDKAKKAHAMLNSHQVAGSRCFCAEDKVLALAPLIDYQEWRKATDGVPGSDLVQASVAWAFGVVEDSLQTFRWCLRSYHSFDNPASHLDSLAPRRNYGWKTSKYGTKSGEVTFTLGSPISLADETSLTLLTSVVMTHPGKPGLSWGGGPWTSIRDVIRTDEGFRLSTEWGAEFWLASDALSHTESAVFLVKSEGLSDRFHMVVAILFANDPSKGKLLSIIDIPTDVLDDLKSTLTAKSIRPIDQSFTLVSDGIPDSASAPPPPLPEPAKTDDEPTTEDVPREDSSPAAAEEVKPDQKEDKAEDEPLPPSIIKGDTRIHGAGIEVAAGHGPHVPIAEKASRKGGFSSLFGC